MTALEAMLDEVNVNLLLASAAWFTLVWLFDGVWLSLRNYNVVRATTTPPPELGGQLSQETLDKARAYTLDKGALSLVHGTFGHAVHLAQLFCGFMPWLWAFSGSLAPGCTELTQSLVLLVVSTLIEVVIELPWDVYSTFVLEQKHGFNKQTAAFFAVDQLKKLALNIVLQVLIVGLLLQIILWAGDNFFLYAWALVAGFTMAMMAIFPDYIAPMFDTFVPLPEGELRRQIEDLAASLSFPLTKLQVVIGSKRSSHSNAYFYGFGKSKRIVLFDTLLIPELRPVAEKDNEGEEGKEGTDAGEETAAAKEGQKDVGCTIDEVVAVLSHELGHWSSNHVLKNLVLVQLQILLIFYLFQELANSSKLFLDFGFEPGVQPMFMGMLLVTSYILSPLSFVMSLAMTQLSRRFEFEADSFAENLGRAEPLQRALLKLNKDNLGFPVSDSLYSSVHHTHPTLIERIRALTPKKDQ